MPPAPQNRSATVRGSNVRSIVGLDTQAVYPRILISSRGKPRAAHVRPFTYAPSRVQRTFVRSRTHRPACSARSSVHVRTVPRAAHVRPFTYEPSRVQRTFVRSRTHRPACSARSSVHVRTVPRAAHVPSFTYAPSRVQRTFVRSRDVSSSNAELGYSGSTRRSARRGKRPEFNRDRKVRSDIPVLRASSLAPIARSAGRSASHSRRSSRYST